jgi:predicted PurR-regulated permease PerM
VRSRSRAERAALIVLAAIAAVAALRLGRDFFSPVALALVAALALSPIVRRLSRWLPPWLAAAVVVGTVVAGAIGLAYGLSGQVVTLVDELPVAAREVRQAIQTASSTRSGPLARIEAALGELQRAAGNVRVNPGVTSVTIVDAPTGVREQFLGAVGQVTFVGGQATLVIFLVYFLLASGDQFKRKFVSLSGPNLSERRVTVEMIDAIISRTSGFLVQLTLVSTIVGVATWLAFLWMGVHYAGIWGIAAALFNVMPYVGPLMIFGGSSVAALVQFGSLQQAAIVGGASLAITSVEGMVLSPLLFGRMAHVNPVAVFLSLLFWNWVWGPIGVLLAVPLLVIGKTIADHVDSFRVFAELVGD